MEDPIHDAVDALAKSCEPFVSSLLMAKIVIKQPVLLALLPSWRSRGPIQASHRHNGPIATPTGSGHLVTMVKPMALAQKMVQTPTF